jgi:hypothetical protein
MSNAGTNYVPVVAAHQTAQLAKSRSGIEWSRVWHAKSPAMQSMKRGSSSF